MALSFLVTAVTEIDSTLISISGIEVCASRPQFEVPAIAPSASTPAGEAWNLSIIGTLTEVMASIEDDNVEAVSEPEALTTNITLENVVSEDGLPVRVRVLWADKPTVIGGNVKVTVVPKCLVAIYRFLRKRNLVP